MSKRKTKRNEPDFLADLPALPETLQGFDWIAAGQEYSRLMKGRGTDEPTAEDFEAMARAGLHVKYH